MSDIDTGTLLSDVIVPEVYYEYSEVNTTALTEFIDSGVMRDDERISKFLSGGGTTFNVPFWSDILDDDEGNVSSDALASKATPGKITAGKQTGVRLSRNKPMASADLTAEFAGSDPMKRIADRIDPWWARQKQRTAIAVTRAVVDDSVASHASDMVVNIHTNGAAGSSNMISVEAVILAKATAGDNAKFDTIAVHSVTQTSMKLQNTASGRSAYLNANETKDDFDTYLGMRVIVDDSLTVDTTGAEPKYYTFMYRTGAISTGTAMPKKPIAISRDELAGDGGGAEMLVTRKTWCAHPQGYSWIGTAAGDTPTNAELADDANWLRVFPERKQIPVCAILSNG